MGAFFDSIAVPTSDAGAVRALVSAWLGAKGFAPRPGPPLFPCDDETERGLYLFSNDRWVVALYSHMHVEGRRLLHELGKLGRPLLHLWVHDSDVWGYDLHQDGEVVASFNSDPNYFGDGEESPPPADGDPALLRALLPVEADEETLAEIQRGRALFRESVCRRFCAALGAAPAGVGYRDVEVVNLPAPGPVTVHGFRVEQFLFVARDRGGPEAVPDLHGLTFQPSDAAPPPDELPEELQDYLDAWRTRIKIGLALLWPLFVLLRVGAWVYVRLWNTPWFRRLLGRRDPLAASPFVRDLFAQGRPGYRVEGRTVINDRHRCRIELPERAEAVPATWSRWTLLFRVGPLTVHAQAVRPGALRDYFRLHPSAELAADEKFFAGPLPAREVVQRFHRPDGPAYHYASFVQGEQAAYVFSGTSLEELSADDRAALRAAVESFRQE